MRKRFRLYRLMTILSCVVMLVSPLLAAAFMSRRMEQVLEAMKLAAPDNVEQIMADMRALPYVLPTGAGVALLGLVCFLLFRHLMIVEDRKAQAP